MLNIINTGEVQTKTTVRLSHTARIIKNEKDEQQTLSENICY